MSVNAGGAPVPYRNGDRVRLRLGNEVVEVTVSTVIPTDSLDPSRRWRLLYRVDGGDVRDVPVHCGDDGQGEFVVTDDRVEATAPPGVGAHAEGVTPRP